MVSITITGSDVLLEKLASLPGAARATIAVKSQELAQELAAKVRDEKLSGQVLNSKTGRLKSSIDSNIELNGATINASVFSAGDVPYAAIQEYGGSTKAHIIEATNAKALAFSWQGKSVFYKYVNHPGSNIPERSYLRSSLTEMQDEIVGAIAEAVNEALGSI